jgi:hypothetical protein
MIDFVHEGFSFCEVAEVLANRPKRLGGRRIVSWETSGEELIGKLLVFPPTLCLFSTGVPFPIWNRFAISQAVSPSASQCSAIFSRCVSIFEKEQRIWRALRRTVSGRSTILGGMETSISDSNFTGILIFRFMSGLLPSGHKTWVEHH